MSCFEEVNKKIKEYYIPYAERASPAWHSDISQRVRFESVEKILPKKLSLLDVGCGPGDFPIFLLTKRHRIDYTGIDIVPGMITVAQKRYPKGKFFVSSVFDAVPDNSRDWVIAIGITEIEMTRRYLVEAVRKMLDYAREGIAFTCLWKDKKLLRQHETMFNPNWVFNVLRRRMTERVIIDMSYASHCYTAIVYKKESEWKKEWNRRGGWQ